MPELAMHKKEALKIKADAIWEMAGGHRTFAGNFMWRESGHYSAAIGAGELKFGSLAVCERAKMGCTMLEIPRKIAQAWDETGVEYEHKKGKRRSRSVGARWYLYLDDEVEMAVWAKHIADAVEYLENGTVPTNARELNEQYAKADKEGKLRMVKRVERGHVGKGMKMHRGHKCQICEAMGMNPIGFMTERGIPYTEAHHVDEVSKGGGLGPENIVVLCANHHRQMHYGNVTLVRKDSGEFEFCIDGITVKVARYSP